ncbi:MAG: chlorite dismutase family protein [Phycisphaeraceae bacterium]
MNSRLFRFCGGNTGLWRVTECRALHGQPLAAVTHLSILSGDTPDILAGAVWTLRGMVSNSRYTTRQELDRLNAVSPALGRVEATCAALIPIRKSAAWWALAQDERRAIVEERSHHIDIGLHYLPAVARRLHHCRDLGAEPFDFLTWFEFAPCDVKPFEELVSRLRETDEWSYVEREMDLRLTRSPG